MPHLAKNIRRMECQRYSFIYRYNNNRIEVLFLSREFTLEPSLVVFGTK